MSSRVACERGSWSRIRQRDHAFRVAPAPPEIGRLLAVAPTQGEVDDFMAANKVVPTGPMAWEQKSKTQVLWRAAVEIDAAQVGMVTFYVNPTFPRRWTFKLSFHREEVYRLDVKPFVNHSNPPDRPKGWPGKVTEEVHEHRWFEGLDLFCARPLAGLSSADHRRILEAFCKQARIDLGPDYIDPVKGVQLEI